MLGNHYHSHTRLNTLFSENGAPGEPPAGNCVTKCSSWLKRCNSDEGTDPLEVLGRVLQEYMDSDYEHSDKERIKNVLGKNGLSYQLNGYVVRTGFSPASKSLSDIIRAKDFSVIEMEFNRAYAFIQKDPAAGITAASSMIEAVCKTYIHDHELTMPGKQTIQELWKVVRDSLGLDPSNVEDMDQKKILSGLTSIVDGVGSLRTHIGSAHDRGPNMRNAEVREPRLAISASQALTLFILDAWILEST